MADIEEFARKLAEQVREKLSVISQAEKLQLHRRRILDANLQHFWDLFIAELTKGVRAFDSAMAGTLMDQETQIDADTRHEITLTRQYPRRHYLTVALDHERASIALIRSNINNHGADTREFGMSVVQDDQIEGVEQNVSVGGPTELAQVALEYFKVR
ncbi:MAG: hypothetical protein ACR2JB_23415 [Bryobacteraceae bacterium]|jgi:hypothetical protein